MALAHGYARVGPKAAVVVLDRSAGPDEVRPLLEALCRAVADGSVDIEGFPSPPTATVLEDQFVTWKRQRQAYQPRGPVALEMSSTSSTSSTSGWRFRDSIGAFGVITLLGLLGLGGCLELARAFGPHC